MIQVSSDSAPAAEGAFAFADMAVKPEYTRERVNIAGKALVQGFFGVPPISLDQTDWERHWDEWAENIAVINNWRSAHGYPLNTFQTTLRNSARRFDADALIAQRTKRLISIAAKLNREPRMKLSQMQDIGGCRAVVKSVAEVRSLVSYYEKEIRLQHTLATKDDYIDEPKSSGYRGVHLVYRFHSDRPAAVAYNGLKIEMQIRSKYQHAWATAVETVGTFVQQALKSSQGEEDWLRFFELMGSVIALRERLPLVPNTPTKRKELIATLAEYTARLGVVNHLTGYRNALRHITERANPSDRYFLLELEASKNRLVVTGFPLHELPEAQRKYALAEQMVRSHPGADAVLVSVDSLTALERAYPNYFADTRVFIQLLNQALSGSSHGISVQPLKLDSDNSLALVRRQPS